MRYCSLRFAAQYLNRFFSPHAAATQLNRKQDSLSRLSGNRMNPLRYLKNNLVEKIELIPKAIKRITYLSELNDSERLR